MILEKVIYGSGCTLVKGDAGTIVTSVCNDSRKVTPGSLFVAVKGYASDGHSFIATAVEKGACAIVYEDQALAQAQMEAALALDVTMATKTMGELIRQANRAHQDNNTAVILEYRV